MSQSASPSVLRSRVQKIRSISWIFFAGLVFILPRVINPEARIAYRLVDRQWEQFSELPEPVSLVSSPAAVWAVSYRAAYLLQGDRWEERWSTEEALFNTYAVGPDGTLAIAESETLWTIPPQGPAQEQPLKTVLLQLLFAADGTLYGVSPEGAILALGDTERTIVQADMQRDAYEIQALTATSQGIIELSNEIRFYALNGNAETRTILSSSSVPENVWKFVGASSEHVWFAVDPTYRDIVPKVATPFIAVAADGSAAALLPDLPDSSSPVLHAWVDDGRLLALNDQAIWRLSGEAWEKVNPIGPLPGSSSLTDLRVTQAKDSLVAVSERQLPFFGSTTTLFLTAFAALTCLELCAWLALQTLERKVRKAERTVLASLAPREHTGPKSAAPKRRRRTAGTVMRFVQWIGFVTIVVTASVLLNLLGVTSPLLHYPLLFVGLTIFGLVILIPYSFWKFSGLRQVLAALQKADYRKAIQIASTGSAAGRVELLEMHGIALFFANDLPGCRSAFHKTFSELQHLHGAAEVKALASCCSAYARVLLLAGDAAEAERQLAYAASLAEEHFEVPLTRAELLLSRSGDPHEALAQLAVAEKQNDPLLARLVLQDQSALVRLSAAKVRAYSAAGSVEKAKQALAVGKAAEVRGSAVYERVLLKLAEAEFALHRGERKVAADLMYEASRIDPAGFAGLLAARKRAALMHTKDRPAGTELPLH